MDQEHHKVKIRVCFGGAWELVNGILEYGPFNIMKRSLQLPLGVTHSMLMNRVAGKCSLDTRSGFRLSYISNNDLMEITDDDDVEDFIDYVTGSEGFTTLYVVDIGGTSGTGSNQHSFVSTAIKNSNAHPAPHEFQSHEEYHQPTYHYQTQQLGVQSDKTYAQEYDKLSAFDDDIDVVELASKEIDVTKTKPSKFWLMPPLVQPQAQVITQVMTTSYQLSSHVKLNQYFDDKDALRVALGLKCVEEGFQTKVTRSCPKYFEAKCIFKNCEWLLRARVASDDSFRVTKLLDQHTCSKTQTYPNHRQANKQVLGSILKEAMVEDSRIYKGKEIMSDIQARYKISVSYQQAWRAKNYAIDLLRGTPEDSFADLPLYCHNLQKMNPGTKYHIETDSLGRFEFLFIAFGASIRSFTRHLRPLIVIDAAHLKGRYRGQMFLAVGMDGNNHILPLAYGVGKSEDGENWTRFMSKLRQCIGEMENLTIISDRAASINLAIMKVFPNAFHGLCCRHLLMNLRAKHSDIKDIEYLYWNACNAYRVSNFNEAFNTLRSAVPTCCDKLIEIGKEKWSRVHFPGRRYNYMTSNSAESFNSLCRHARKLPITMLIEFFRANQQNWYSQYGQDGDKFKHVLTPWAEEEVAKRVSNSGKWKVRPAADYIFEVKDYHKDGVVNLREQTCTCGQWQLSGLPCGHVAAVTRHLELSDCSQFASPYYTTNVYRATYHDVIYPVGHRSEWEVPDDLITVLPPTMEKRQAGRPRGVNRILSVGEEKRTKTCTRCRLSGHTRLTCPTPLPEDNYNPSGSEKSQSRSKKSQSIPFAVNLNDN